MVGFLFPLGILYPFLLEHLLDLARVWPQKTYQNCLVIAHECTWMLVFAWRFEVLGSFQNPLVESLRPLLILGFMLAGNLIHLLPYFSKVPSIVQIAEIAPVESRSTERNFRRAILSCLSS